MIKVYISGLVLLAVTYLSQLHLRTHASTEMLFVFGVYLTLVNWSVVAESVVFITPAEGPTQRSKRHGLISELLISVALDPIVIACLAIIVGMYLYLNGVQGKSAFGSAQLIGVVALSFWLRIAESSAKSFASRSGNYKQQQIIINLFSSLKWIAIPVLVMIESELGIYLCISLVSIISISILTRFFNESFSNDNVQQVNQDTNQQRWLMLLATVVGIIGYQIDKILALKYLEKSEAGIYILSYSLIFMLIQALGPLYTKYISDKWMEIGLNSKSLFFNTALFKIIILMAYIGAILNLIAIVISAPYFGYEFLEIREVYDVIWLSAAVIFCALNHLYYFDFAAARRYDRIFYQNLSGLILGSGAAIFAFVQDFSCGLGFIPFFVNAGQYFYVLINRDVHGQNRLKIAIHEIAKILLPIGGVVVVGQVALGAYTKSSPYIAMGLVVASSLYITGSIIIMIIGLDGGVINNLKKTFS